ncbi:MAG: hypothetical protein EAX96_19580 [Candidatus Lokiarchaeota archaeon]|nr:hypothetical protein [Candidatus Lokiarchaeota archaeon]
MVIQFTFFGYSGFMIAVAVISIIGSSFLVISGYIKTEQKLNPYFLFLISGYGSIAMLFISIYLPTGYTSLTSEAELASNLVLFFQSVLPNIIYTITFGGCLTILGVIEFREDQDARSLIYSGIAWTTSYGFSLINSVFFNQNIIIMLQDVEAMQAMETLLFYGLFSFVSFITNIAGAYFLYKYGRKVDNKMIILAGLIFLVNVVISLFSSLFAISGLSNLSNIGLGDFL